jgi:hypothetical protein
VPGGCPRCGAVTSGTLGGRGFSNAEKHAEWHRKQDELLKAHDDMLKALTNTVLELTKGAVAPGD